MFNPTCPATVYSTSVTCETDGDLFTWSETEPSDVSSRNSLLDTSLSLLPVRDSCPSPLVHTSFGLRLNCRPQSRCAMQSICQQGDCFSALEILAWNINVAAGLKDPSSGYKESAWGGIRAFSQAPAECLGTDRTLWSHSFSWQLSFSLQPGLDKASNGQYSLIFSFRTCK